MKQKTRTTGFQWSMLISTANDEAYVNMYVFSFNEKQWYRYGGFSSKEFVFHIFNCSVFYILFHSDYFFSSRDT